MLQVQGSVIYMFMTGGGSSHRFEVLKLKTPRIFLQDIVESIPLFHLKYIILKTSGQSYPSGKHVDTAGSGFCRLHVLGRGVWCIVIVWSPQAKNVMGFSSEPCRIDFPLSFKEHYIKNLSFKVHYIKDIWSFFRMAYSNAWLVPFVGYTVCITFWGEPRGVGIYHPFSVLVYAVWPLHRDFSMLFYEKWSGFFNLRIGCDSPIPGTDGLKSPPKD